MEKEKKKGISSGTIDSTKSYKRVQTLAS